MKANRSNTNISIQSPHCAPVQAQLLEYADHTLTPQAIHAVEAHLDVCQACASELAQIRRAESALSTARRSIPAPGDLYAGFAAKMANEPVRRVNTWRYAVPAFAMVALALFISAARHNQNPAGVAAIDDRSGLLAAIGPKSEIEHLPFNIPLTIRRNPNVPSDSHSAAVSLNSRLSGLVRRESEREVAFNSLAADLYGRKKSRFTDVNLLGDAVAATRMPESNQTNLYALSEPVDKLSAGVATDPVRFKSNFALSYKRTTSDDEQLGLERHSNLFAEVSAAAPPAVSFALYVQDDERGFTAEAHDAGTVIPSGTNAGGDNGIKIEVEFDDAGAL